VRASLIEEWDEITGTVRMQPMMSLFDSDEQATQLARPHASRSGLKQIYLTDSRKPPQVIATGQ
jgi:hypothetical protein